MVVNPPESLAELESAITAKHISLSKRLQQVAQFVMDHPKNIAFGTVAAIAQDANVPPSTLVRFANAFGFQGFSDMQRLFRAKLVEDNPSYNERIRLAKEQLSQPSPTSPIQLLNEFASANMLAMDQLKAEADADKLELAINILEKANVIHIVGFRRSFVIASYFAYALRHIDKSAFLVDGVGGMFREQASVIQPQDAMVAISFKPYATETQETIKAKPAEVPLIVITDSQLSPLVQQATVSFVVKEAEVRSFRSLTSSLCIAQALSIGLAYRQEEI
ncbi:MurR/RpiR family transcriptional regulator [Endozoicomonas sp. SM1973]|uniref:MurR/RpiR family transcriptional regulator n=1 Tax=Spartinivicinus marinus TaxID=2994442 RepID=A0A853IG67_9GAMM|nr:MurR/RpiR family transcriptional regulator [Spartinivicinus marinus]MCX4025950.1 MurR/RpiR family transcriptional regulator [Spartinivicinus marinus]NYZ68135.1 MurR/RpiR family transcriptional regulator [Spartinivicinus marinus]